MPELYHAYKQFGRSPVPLAEGFNFDALSNDEFDLIEEVYKVFGQYSAWQLRDMTHEEAPWANHETYAEEIPHNELAEYFRARIN